jgi:hypothetical protein
MRLWRRTSLRARQLQQYQFSLLTRQLTLFKSNLQSRATSRKLFHARSMILPKNSCCAKSFIALGTVDIYEKTFRWTNGKCGSDGERHPNLVNPTGIDDDGIPSATFFVSFPVLRSLFWIAQTMFPNASSRQSDTSWRLCYDLVQYRYSYLPFPIPRTYSRHKRINYFFILLGYIRLMEAWVFSFQKWYLRRMWNRVRAQWSLVEEINAVNWDRVEGKSREFEIDTIT